MGAVARSDVELVDLCMLRELLRAWEAAWEIFGRLLGAECGGSAEQMAKLHSNVCGKIRDCGATGY